MSNSFCEYPKRILDAYGIRRIVNSIRDESEALNLLVSTVAAVVAPAQKMESKSARDSKTTSKLSPVNSGTDE